MLDVDTSLMGFINENNIKDEIHGNQKLMQGQILILKINTEYIAEIQERFGLTINTDLTFLKKIILEELKLSLFLNLD